MDSVLADINVDDGMAIDDVTTKKMTRSKDEKRKRERRDKTDKKTGSKESIAIKDKRYDDASMSKEDKKSKRKHADVDIEAESTAKEKKKRKGGDV